RLWDIATEKARLLGMHTEAVRSVAFSADGKTLASGSDDQTIKLWDPVTGEELFALKGHTRRVNSVSFAPDGKAVASGDHGGGVMIWHAAATDKAPSDAR